MFVIRPSVFGKVMALIGLFYTGFEDNSPRLPFHKGLSENVKATVGFSRQSVYLSDVLP